MEPCFSVAKRSGIWYKKFFKKELDKSTTRKYYCIKQVIQ